MIEAGIVKAGIVVTAETVSPMIDATIRTLLADQTIQRDQLLKVLQ